MAARIFNRATGPLGRTKKPGVFHSATDDRYLVTHVADPPQTSSETRELARDLLKRAADPNLRPTGAELPYVLVDTAKYSPQQLRDLARELVKQGAGKPHVLRRVMSVSSETGVLEPFHKLGRVP
jgi:hypothetical protein